MAACGHFAGRTFDSKSAVGLVFLSAFALDEGENAAGIQEPYPPSLVGKNVEPTPYDAPWSAGWTRPVHPHLAVS